MYRIDHQASVGVEQSDTRFVFPGIRLVFVQVGDEKPVAFGGFQLAPYHGNTDGAGAVAHTHFTVVVGQKKKAVAGDGCSGKIAGKNLVQGCIDKIGALGVGKYLVDAVLEFGIRQVLVGIVSVVLVKNSEPIRADGIARMYVYFPGAVGGVEQHNFVAQVGYGQVFEDFGGIVFGE